MSLIGSLVAHPVMRSCCACWCPRASYSKVRPIGISYRSCVCVYVCVSQCASVLSTELDRTTNRVVGHVGGFRIDQISAFCDPNIQTWSSRPPVRPSVRPSTDQPIHSNPASRSSRPKHTHKGIQHVPNVNCTTVLVECQDSKHHHHDDNTTNTTTQQKEDHHDHADYRSPLCLFVCLCYESV